MQEKQKTGKQTKPTQSSLWTADSLRKIWKDYFIAKNHHFLSSASLLPLDDHTLLFTTAGMVPFKDYFSGRSKPPAPQVASIQKCLRTTDLDCVGKTDRHCSFFEMLGNFSFGSYFKREAIKYAWEFSIECLKLDPKKIYVTIFEEDDEAESIWKEEIGIEKSHISRLGKTDNWWGPAGEQGPCGPCSELYFDRGEDFCKTCNCSNKNKCAPGGDGERFMEYWNLVFNEFYSDSQAQLQPLNHKGIDTGAGLERILALLCNKPSIYETDEFQEIIRAIEEKSKSLRQTKELISYKLSKTKVAFRVISDHLRSTVFSIADGILPSNTGRGYVIRRMIRRSSLYARELEVTMPLLHQLVDVIVKIYGKNYPELITRKENIKSTLLAEENRFLETLDFGLKKWQELLEKYRWKQVLPGKAAFLLYDTYGFPLELTIELAEREKLVLDREEFDHELENQRHRSTNSAKWKDIALPPLEIAKSIFLGYESHQSKAKVLAIIQNGKSIKNIKPKSGNEYDETDENPTIVIIDQSPFYTEGGGQLGDKGQIISEDGAIFSVTDTQKSGDLILHLGHINSGSITLGTKVKARIDSKRRDELSKNHSATHLLNKVLCDELGDHVLQTGSLVAPNYLRFDFSHSEKIPHTILSNISKKVNVAIKAKTQVKAQVMSIAKAREIGAKATFGEKYGQEVRVISIGDNGKFSLELCGGCHVKNTADIAFFHILRETSPGAGNRRIEAITGKYAREYFQEELTQLQTEIKCHNNELAELIKNNPSKKDKIIELEFKKVNTDIIALGPFIKDEELSLISTKLENWKEKILNIRKKKIKLMKEISAQILSEAAEKYLSPKAKMLQKIGPLQILILTQDQQDKLEPRLLVEKIKEKSRGIVILLGLRSANKTSLLFSADATAIKYDLNMAQIIKVAAKYIDGNGGGRTDMAQAGGKKDGSLDDALKYAEKEIRKIIETREEVYRKS